jgi:phosphoglycerate dehydrogenase-like enzyme
VTPGQAQHLRGSGDFFHLNAVRAFPPSARALVAVWDNFFMDTMDKKTVGLLGYGSIGQATAKAAKAAFGSRIIALRRQSSLGEVGVVERVYGLGEKEEFFKACDFVVCSLPNTPHTKVTGGMASTHGKCPCCYFEVDHICRVPSN